MRARRGSCAPSYLKKGVYQCGHDYEYMSNEQVYELMSYKYEGAVHSELRSVVPKNTHHQWLSPVVHETDALPYQLFGNKARKWMLLRKDWTLEDIEMPDAEVDEKIFMEAEDVEKAADEDAFFAGATRDQEETVHHEDGAKANQNPTSTGEQHGRSNYRHKATYHFTYPIAFRNELEREAAVRHKSRTSLSSTGAVSGRRDDSSSSSSTTSGTSTTNSSSTFNREDEYSGTPVDDAEEYALPKYRSSTNCIYKLAQHDKCTLTL